MLEFYLTLIGMIFLLLVLTGTTFAWFTQTSFVNTDVYSASVDGGTPSLLISLQADGEFDRECQLIPDLLPEKLYPVSTEDLHTFYKGTAVKADGITYLYTQADNENCLIQGSVYLKSINGNNDVYFDDEKFKVGMVDGSDAGLRLGIRINEDIFIFNLDEGNAEGRNTIEAQNDSVVSTIDAYGNPVYVDDPSINPDAFVAQGETAGEKLLVSIEEDQVVKVDYYVYLEGCDRDCYNVIMNKDLQITLGFQGVPVNGQ